MFRGLTLLLTAQLVGEALARGLNAPIPGPVIGMALFVLILWGLDLAPPAFTELREEVYRVCNSLLAMLGVLFVPAGVGVVRHIDLIMGYGVKIGLVLVASALLTMAVTALVFNALSPSADQPDG